MNALLANIDARKGEASFPADVELITRMVKASVGFDAMNAVVVKEMRRQMAASAPPTQVSILDLCSALHAKWLPITSTTRRVPHSSRNHNIGSNSKRCWRY